MVRLTGYGDRKPAELSGGQRQRVALARSIVNRPRVLLLDEPLGALDLKLREQMQVELKQIQHEVGITFVYVTHDQEEALTMSDRIAVFNAGPDRAGRHAGRGLRAAREPVRVRLRRRLERARARRRHVHVRPEKVRLLEPGEPTDGLQTERGTIRDVAYAGMITRYLVALDAGGELQVVRQNLETSSAEALEQVGREVVVGWRPEHTVAVSSAVTERRTMMRSNGRKSRQGRLADRRRVARVHARVRRRLRQQRRHRPPTSERRADVGRQGRGRAQPRSTGPATSRTASTTTRRYDWVTRLREADRLPGQLQGRPAPPTRWSS